MPNIPTYIKPDLFTCLRIVSLMGVEASYHVLWQLLDSIYHQPADQFPYYVFHRRNPGEAG